MALDIHTVSLLEGSASARTDRVLASFYPNVPTAAGSAAGASVSVAVALNLSVPYVVQATPSQDAVTYITKTNTGFTVTLSPRVAANTLVAGTVDILVIA